MSTEAVVNLGLILSYILLGGAAIAAIVLPLIQAMGEPKSLIKSGIGVGALIVLFVICYLLAGSDSYGSDVSAGTSKRVGAGIIMFYILALGAIAGIVYTEIVKATK